MPELLKKFLIFIIISGLCVSAFFIRFNNSHKLSFKATTDEELYSTMARQMTRNLLDYSGSGFALHQKIFFGIDYPDYFHDPLFKHPPLFTLMLVSSRKIFFPPRSAVRIPPVLFGVLSIALVYLLGQLTAGRATGLIAAGMMWLDPVAIMSSQKIWMDAPLMFFMLLTVYTYFRAMKKKQAGFFLLGGLSAGAAVMIKYPGILTFLGTILFALMIRPRIFKNRFFQISLALPVFISLPWIIWNCHVYGLDFIRHQLAVHEFFSLAILFTATIVLTAGFLLPVIIKNAHLIPGRTTALLSSPAATAFKYLGFLGALAFSFSHGVQALDPIPLPSTSWTQGTYALEPLWFYFGRLLEYSMLYAFAYLAFFDPFFKRPKGIFLLKVNAFLIMMFFVAWGNFQSRYILPALPFLMVLAADYICSLFERIGKIDRIALRLLLRSALLIFIILAATKTVIINHEISFTNDVCYF